MADYQGDLWYKNGAMYKNESCTDRLTPFHTEPPYLLVGEFPGTGWDPAAEPNFTKEGDTSKYSITIENVAARKYLYKVLQNPAEPDRYCYRTAFLQ